MATITSANVASAIVKLVAADALPALMGNLVMGNLVNRDYEPALAQAGDTINVPIPPTLVANNIAEGGTVQTQNPSLGNAQIVLNTHAEATFQVPDVTKILAVPDLLKLYMQPAVVALAERIESDLLGLYPQFTANTAVGTGGTTITEATVDSAETALFSTKAGERGEVPSGGRSHLLGAAADSAFQRIQLGGRSRTARDRGWGSGQDEGLLHLPLAVRCEDGEQPRDHAQSGVCEERNWPGSTPAAAASAGNGRDCGVCRARQFRDARHYELSTEYAGAAVHGGRALWRRRAAE
jgi:hypothetical protein